MADVQRQLTFKTSNVPGIRWAFGRAFGRTSGRTVVGGARVVSGAETKIHLIEAALFGRLDQM